MTVDERETEETCPHCERRRRRAQCHDEGSVLVMVLALIVIVSVACAMVMTAQYTGDRTQRAASATAIADINADSVLQAAIAKIRKDPTGKIGKLDARGLTQCGTSVALSTSAVPTGPQQANALLYTYTDPSTGRTYAV